MLGNGELSLFNLPRVDVIYAKLFTRIHPKDLWICRRVCREFQRLCDEYFQSYCAILDFSERLLTVDGLSLLMSRCRSVKCFYWHSTQFPNVTIHLANYKTYFWGGKQLRVLDLCNVDLSGVANSYIGHYCKELRVLRVTNCLVSCNDLLKELLTNTRLCEVDLSKSVFSPDSFRNFISLKKELSVLKVSYCTRISQLDLQAAARSCPNLREVDLQYTRASDVTVQHMMEYCPQLTTLLLKGCHISNQRVLYQMTERKIKSDVLNNIQMSHHCQYKSLYMQI